MIDCPSECQKSYKTVKQINDCNIIDCLICGHRFVRIEKPSQHIEQNYNDDYFIGGGDGKYTDYFSESKILYKRGEKYARLLKSLDIQPGKILDVGAAAGFILKAYSDNGWQAVGLEPNKTMARFANEKLGLEVYNSTFEDFESQHSFGCISIIQVVAHFYDLEKAFQKAFDLLKEDGILIIETWNRKSLIAKIFGWKWHEYNPPTVIHWFSPKSLTVFLQKSGFVLIRQGRVFKKINGEHAKNIIINKVKSKMLKRVLNIIPNRMNLIYPFGDLFYLVLKKQSKQSNSPLFN